MRFNLNLKPREVEAYLREQVLKIFGNEVEDGTTITASNGRYTLSVSSVIYEFSVGKFRKKDVPRIIKSLKFLKGE